MYCNILIVLFINLISSTIATHQQINLKIEPLQREIIKPIQNQLETYVNITANKGCKLVLNCAFSIAKCSIASIKVYTGRDFYNICPDQHYSFVNISFENYMNLTMHNAAEEQYIYCSVKSTQPFLNMQQEIIDSSEHGQRKPGMKKKECKCGWTNKNPKRIIGGSEAGINEYPFIASIRYKKIPSSFCGGSIITNKHVLTAAHCFNRKVNYALCVVVGEHDILKKNETTATKEIDVERIIIHEHYNPKTDNNDIAILLLKHTINFTKMIGPICVPKVQKNYVGKFVKVIGWGKTKDQKYGGELSVVLKKTNLRVIDPDICLMLYKSNSKFQICTFNDGQDSCQGDSGGPLIGLDQESNMYYQIGLVSFGRECGSTDPSVNTDVASYIKWIRKQVEATSPSSILCN